MSLDVDDLEEPIKPYTEKDHSEYKIHVAIVDHIMGRITGNKAFNALCLHIFQGRGLDGTEGFFLKKLGVMAGVADLLLLWRSKCDCGASRIGIGFLEVKKPDGTQLTAQRKFAGICHWLGIPYAIVRSVKDAHAVLAGWGCPENHKSIKEPDTRTTQQKYQDVHNMYKRD